MMIAVRLSQSLMPVNLPLTVGHRVQSTGERHQCKNNQVWTMKTVVVWQAVKPD
jgi:hypothetical protein